MGLNKIYFPAGIIKTKGKIKYLTAGKGPLTQPLEGSLNIYAPDFELNSSQPWWSFKRVDDLLVDPVEPEGFSLVEPDFDAFDGKFQSYQKAIQSGEINKIVPVVFASFKVSHFEQFIQNRMCFLSKNSSENLMPYALWTKSEGILGLTPELLFKVENNILSTMALAGTAHAQFVSDEEFLADEKESKEHQIVVEAICNQLSSFGVVKTSERKVHRLPKIKHLKTDIEVKLNQSIEFEEIVRILHPTPALGVAPREKLSKWQIEMDVESRRLRYGAPFGWLGPDGEMECYVAIRNIQWQGQDVLLGSGCGVVAESKLLSEWEELKMKRDQVKDLLGL